MNELFTNRELRDACTLENFTMLPDTALLPHPKSQVTHNLCVRLTMLTPFLLNCELFFKSELFANSELCEAHTDASGNLLYVYALIKVWHTYI